MVYHSFTSECQSVKSLGWSLVCLMKLYHVAPWFHVGRLDKFTCSLRCMFVTFVHFACFIRSSVGDPIHLHVLPSFIPFIVLKCFLVYLYLQSLMTKRHQIQNLLVHHDTWSFRCRWSREVAGLWCRMMVLSNCLVMQCVCIYSQLHCLFPLFLPILYLDTLIYWWVIIRNEWTTLD